MKKLQLFFIVLLLVSVGLFAAGKAGYQKIDPKKCTACGSCIEVCPSGAISKTKFNGKVVYTIDPAKCTDCGACVEACEYGSISHVAAGKPVAVAQPAATAKPAPKK